MNLLLTPIAALYECVVKVRHKLFDWGIIKSQEFDIPVVCVGNLTVGGTGKTPVAEFLIEHLSRNYNVALLSRGYKRKTSGYVEVDVNSPFLSVGDEPKQIKLKFPNIVVAVCEKRVEGIRRIRAAHPEVNLIVLDDGFQHRYVEPWANVLLMDYSRPVYKDKFLPVGSLRDSCSQLHRANFVFVTKCPKTISPLDMRIVRTSLGLFPYQSLFFTAMRSGDPAPVFTDMANKRIPKQTPVIAMSGIGNPKSFSDSLVEQGYDVVDRMVFPDHHPYRMSDLVRMERLLDQAPAGTIIVTTEKDAVKLTNRKKIPEKIQRALYFIPINLTFIDDGEDEFLRKLNTYVRSNQKYGLLHS